MRALDQLLARPGSPLADAAVNLYAGLAGSRDLRARILMARQFQAKGELENAVRLLPPFAAKLSRADRELMQEIISELGAIEEWRRYLD